MNAVRTLVVVLGDQLDRESAALDGFDSDQDCIWMAEVASESTHVWSHKQRISLFLAAMRRFRDDQRRLGRRVAYRTLDSHPESTLGDALRADLRAFAPRDVRMVRPGDYRVKAMLEAVFADSGVHCERVPDRHFLISINHFNLWAERRKSTRLEHFYRHLRVRLSILMEPDGKTPAGGMWNFDRKNRGTFGRDGPGQIARPVPFEPDQNTRQVLDLVERRFPGHPGKQVAFDWPVSPAQARIALDDFVDFRLSGFGRYQDAMWQGETYLYHARLSSSLNLKLISPREVVEAAVEAHRAGRAPIEAVEGFVRQVLGWREYVRGLYWRHMPGYLDDNALGAHATLPAMYWTGETQMRCLSEVIKQTLRTGYAHHIQRLMVAGLFANLLGVRPRAVHEWFLAVYVDAVEWVELPNTLGMSQYADGGRMASKPYVASGKYIQRMSNYCQGCRFDPGQATGERACPFTTLYWNFLLEHRTRFSRHPRAALQWRSLDRLTVSTQTEIRRQAADLKSRFSRGELL